ncbi:MAG: diguanylate cyclase [Azonexus sp.]
MTDARLLIVDDDPISVKVLRQALDDMGTIHVATSGAEALKLAAEYPLNLVLLDIVMPMMDGFATCRALRCDHPDLPVVFLTAASGPEVEVQALEVGGHDFIGKPINPPVVRARVALHLKLQAQEAARKSVEDRLRSITDAAHDAIVMMTPQGAISFWNPAATAMLGYSAAEALGKNLHDLLAPARYRAAHQMAWSEFQRSGRGAAMGAIVDLSARRKDGQEITVEISLSPLASSDGWHSIGILRDISERKRLEEQLHEQHLLLTTVLTNMDSHVCMKDREGRFLYVNQSSADFLGRPADAIVGHLEAEFIPAANLDEIRAIDMAVFASGSRQCREERLTDQNGATRYFWSVRVPLIHAGKADAIIGMSTEITELRQLQEELERRATTDSLTGLANRGYFYEQANLHFQQAGRYGEALSLLALDIDHFKFINDSHGHQAGDSVLRGLAEHFRQGVRVFDLIGRTGGEEFAILLPKTDLNGAVELAERLRAALTALRFKVGGGTERVVSVSIGAASLLPTDASLDSLFARADQALYRAKAAGRNRVETIEERLPGKRASITHLRWMTAYDCGDPVIDGEHHELFRLANGLLDLASAAASPHAIQAALDGLLAHVVDHFAHEEAILRRHGYAEVEHHAELHQRLVERAQALRAQADQEDIESAELVQFLAQEVVMRHMLQADRSFYGLFANAVR